MSLRVKLILIYQINPHRRRIHLESLAKTGYTVTYVFTDSHANHFNKFYPVSSGILPDA